MTTQEKLIRNKLSLLELAEYLKNVSEACKINGVSRQHFYDIKKAYEEEGLEGLREKSRRNPAKRIGGRPSKSSQEHKIPHPPTATNHPPPNPRQQKSPQKTKKKTYPPPPPVPQKKTTHLNNYGRTL
jgi:hypothetical protein